MFLKALALMMCVTGGDDMVFTQMIELRGFVRCRACPYEITGLAASPTLWRHPTMLATRDH